MLISFFRTLILYLLLFIALRIMGKRQVGQLEPTELVITLLISDLAAIPMGHVSIPMMHGVIPVMTLILAETCLSYMNLKCRKFRKIMSGTPVVLIYRGKICQEQLKKLRMNLDDLMEELRACGQSDVSAIEYAIFETNGSLSVIPKGNQRNVTPEDIGKDVSYNGLPFLLICDGEINHTALEICHKTESWLTEQLAAQDITDIKDVFSAGLSESGKFFAQKRAIS